MFTGIVTAVGRIESMEPRGGDRRVTVATGELDTADLAVGDSVAVNGVCLTAVEAGRERFVADVSGETLANTALGELAAGSPVNLEKALLPTTRLGGHLVSGHVDGVARVLERAPEGRSERFRLEAPAELARYLARKGSVCLDGVSLTVNAVDGARFDLNIVPHTLAATTLDGWTTGSRVNIEVDLVARYLERLLLGEAAADPDAGIDRAFLAEHGFLGG
ncbi:riboflavin synthase alpha chain [Thiohalospira halophila DSM 15071]|uniref:Riboflavin synthase n=1 Tax=Thiohalospira halophila DSM 15071 TaxID=1123397 RepID=A0A1I1U3T7_9GAMM|nr:riboflavin synthase [Thiohalospira halophila]SFD65506.1 riboflavin synthase alpha chain [Thiohalospira halophila DSM 15071]